MTWYTDLAPCDYFSRDTSHFKAIGWLALDKPFSTGKIAEPVFEKLCELLVNPWNPAHPAGFHHCELCRFTRGTGTGQFKDYKVSGLSAASLLVPGKGLIYIAPASITHYIDAHHYQPPAEFCEAVINCPAMRSVPYFKALLANGGRELMQATAA